jgi:hypothetical protein
MSAADLLLTVVIVTLLVTGLLLIVPFVRRRLEQGSDEPDAGHASDGSWYFVRFLPGGDSESR